MRVSIVIPLYKNKELFLTNFAHNIKFIKDYEIIIVDDFSRENIKESLMKIFTKAIYLENDQRLGFSKTVNIGCKKAKGDLIILLNTDVKLLRNFSEGLFERFSNNHELFGISFMQIEKDGSRVGKNKIFFKRGLSRHAKVNNVKAGLNAWLEGGACILRRKVFNELGGLREIYSPFYWEDVDLGYRAYVAGYKILFDPRVLVEHHHESTIRKYFTRDYITFIAYRNQFLFTWCNIHDGRYLLEHIFLLPITLFEFLLKGELLGLKGFLSSILFIPRILAARNEFSQFRKIKDEEIFTLF